MLMSELSLDGRWIAYRTNELSVAQVIVQPVQGASDRKWTISTTGGTEPKWRGDSSELYYLTFDGKMMAVPLKTDPDFEPGKPFELFQTAYRFTNPANPTADKLYTVTADGQRFLVVSAGNASGPIGAIVNWTSGLSSK